MVDRFFADRSSGRNGTVECVLASDYDALAAENADYDNQLEERFMELQRAEARIRDLEAQVESLQNKWARRPLSSEDQGRRIVELEAALRSAGWSPEMIAHFTQETPAERLCKPLCAHGKHAWERCEACEMDGGTGFTTPKETKGEQDG